MFLLFAAGAATPMRLMFVMSCDVTYMHLQMDFVKELFAGFCLSPRIWKGQLMIIAVRG
ncbi:hypothetical protein [Mesorhizobium sp. B1-1-5]|uniref:hypothetical protein n=1 Tax=Mesorhizobium sp. B1-1-5 TaxID=2589979 RepID=UPI0015E27081|nr:hypothetical protein [Mesorhizobium sp. B1-1-5]